MSLQLRILGSIAALLVLALLCGGALLSLHARSVVELEVRTAFRGAEDAVRETLKSDVQHTVTLRQVVGSFEGQRHVRAALVNEKGKVIARSEIGRLASTAPEWFTRLMAPPQMSSRIRINLRQYPCVVELTSDPRSEIAEVWDHVRDAFLIMVLFCGATMAVVSLAVAYAVRFLHRFQTGLTAVSDGSYDARLETRGPPEFAVLARGFNHMAARLESLADSNRNLQQQVQNMQEEERAEIARDLHDEVGPYLFAIQVDAGAMAGSTDPEARLRAGAIREAALHVQQHVKAILRQLRPVSRLDFGLEAAIADLVAFWSHRNPGIRFETMVAADCGLDRRGEEAAYRIVQESLSNAVRHGRPGTIRIVVEKDGDQVLVSVEDDGTGLKPHRRDKMSLGQLGLVGMEERVRALNGRLAVTDLPDGGVCVRVLLPGMRKDTRIQEREEA